MGDLYICNKINKCSSYTCSHKKPHENKKSCDMYPCHQVNDKAYCNLINQGFNPEELIEQSFGGTNE
jgi:hypothetical protein